MSHSHILPRLALGCAVALFWSCDDLEEPSGPGSPEFAEATELQDQPFYYFRPSRTGPDYRIALELDPTEIVIATASRDEALATLAARGLNIESATDVPQAGADHRRIRFPPGTSRDAVVAAAAALRDDPSVSFLGHAYTPEGAESFTLINRLVVRFRDGVGHEEIHKFVESSGMRVLRAAVPDSAKPTWWLAYPRGRDPLTVAAEVHEHPLVSWASPDRLGRIQPDDHVPTDPLYEHQYYLKNAVMRNGIPVDVNAEDAWRLTKGSSNITVAILGSGIDSTHSDLNTRRKGGDCYAGWDEALVEPVYTGSAWMPVGEYCEPGLVCADITSDHETAVAGIIAAQHNGVGTVGIAPNVVLVSARIYAKGVSGSAADAADAIRWAWDFCEADVVSNSWHWEAGWDTDIALAIEEGTEEGRGGTLGTVFVFAGGNIGPGDPPGVVFPGWLSTTISVGAIDRWGEPAAYNPQGTVFPCPPGGPQCAPPAGFSYAPNIVALSGHTLGPFCPSTGDSTAPDIYTTDLVGERGCTADPYPNYMIDFSGTSASTPQVAAAAALLLSVEPDLTWQQVTARLLDSADTWGPYWDFGDGKLNIARSLGVWLPHITSFTMGGAPKVKPNDYCTWSANVSGGTPPYSYSWYKNGYWVGSGAWVSLATGTTNFTLRVDVEDSYDKTATVSRQIKVTGSAMWCPQ